MPSSCRISSLIPSGFAVDSETHIDDEIVLTVRAEAIFAPCPICAAPSRRILNNGIFTIQGGKRAGVAAFDRALESSDGNGLGLGL
jgi:hypothetical protein